MAVLADEFDIVVLGGGPAGYATALYGAAAGLNIALVEAERVGGTCLHRGCIPAKELLQTADVCARCATRPSSASTPAARPVLDLGRAQVRKQEIVDRLTSGTRDAAEGPQRHGGAGSRRGRRRPRSPSCAPRTAPRSRAATSSIATGSAPRALPGLDFDGTRILSSDHVLALTELPPRVAIIGGGVIGAEFASMLIDMGSEVTLLEALPRILADHRRRSRQGGRAVVQEARRQRAGGCAHHRYRRRTRAHGLVGERIGRAVGRRRQGDRVDRPGAAVGRHRARGRRRDHRRPRLRRRRRAVGDECPRCVRGRRRDRRAATRARRLRGRHLDREDGARRASARRSTTTRSRGSSTAGRRSRRAGSPRSRRASRDTTSWSPSTASAATGAP